VIGLGGGELDHIGTHWRSILIQRKARVPNKNVPTIRRLCADSLVGSTLVGSWRLTQNTGRLQPAGWPISAVGAELVLVVPSIAHAIISLCSMAGWQS
jgi:hypothetical protein